MSVLEEQFGASDKNVEDVTRCLTKRPLVCHVKWPRERSIRYRPFDQDETPAGIVKRNSLEEHDERIIF